MKKIIVFTLLAFFATASLLITNPLAEDGYDYDDESVHGVWLIAMVYTWYSDSTAYFYPYGWAYNDSDIAVKCYYNAEGKVGDIADFHDGSNGWVPINDYYHDNNTFKFNMTEQLRGDYTIEGESHIHVKFDRDQDGNFDDWEDVKASTSSDFEYE